MAMMYVKENQIPSRKSTQVLVPSRVLFSGGVHQWCLKWPSGSQRGDLIHARDFLLEVEDIFGSRKEFQSKDFLCSLTPWGAPLCCADQKVGELGRIPYAYACVYKVRSLSRREPLPNHVCRRKTLWNLHLLINWELSGHFRKKQTPSGTINVFL